MSAPKKPKLVDAIREADPASARGGFPREPGVVTADEMATIAAGKLPRRRAPAKKSAAAFFGAAPAPARTKKKPAQSVAEQTPHGHEERSTEPQKVADAPLVIPELTDDGLEIIDGHDVVKIAAEHVMLDVACSPVIFFRRDQNRNPGGDDGSSWGRPCLVGSEAYALDGGNYRVLLSQRYFPFSRLAEMGYMDVSASDLRVMRARWLLRRGEILRAWNDLDREIKGILGDMFFRGQVPFVPPKGSPLDKLAQGALSSPITIPYAEGMQAIDLAALFKALSTPGAEVPATCPAPLEGPDLPPPAPLAPPADAILEGEHGRACCFWKLNDPSVFDVQKIPKDFKCCQAHWERVRVAQGGAFKRFGRERAYVDGRYVNDNGRG